MKRIEIEIRELVLHGFAPADRLRIANAVKQELARLVTDGEGIGRQAAQAIHGGLVGKARR